jgi:hypothetical protein
VQLSFFGAGAQPVEVADLDGLLAGPGQIVRTGSAARVSVVLTTPAHAPGWRAAALLDAYDACGLGGELTQTVEGFAAVRTNFSRELLNLAREWTKGASKAPPPGFALTGPRLRLWAIAAGHRDDHGYVLHLGESDAQTWSAVGRALAEAGVPGALIGPRAHGPAYRITGAKRLNRLAEFVGDPPDGATQSDWPGG